MALCCLPFISSGCKQSETAVKESSISDALYQSLPFEMPKVQQPVFPAYEVNIEKFGAKGDGLFLNTKAINDAIKEVNQRGGGKVIIPEGIWLTGPIELLSNVNLYTEQNALVLFTGDFEASMPDRLIMASVRYTTADTDILSISPRKLLSRMLKQNLLCLRSGKVWQKRIVMQKR